MNKKNKNICRKKKMNSKIYLINKSKKWIKKKTKFKNC